jgi:PAS domain S-box-containing protein
VTRKNTPSDNGQDASAGASNLRLRAESRLRKRKKSPDGGKKLTSEADTQRLLHELQVHQIELEMQNAELEESRYQAETLRDTYIELYDFAPIGYFSLDEKGRILNVNLTGAALLGVVRSRLIGRLLPSLAEPSFKSNLLNLLALVFAGSKKEVGEIRLQKRDGETFWAGLHASTAFSSDLSQQVCRMAISDITELKAAEEARQHVEILTHSNAKLKQEIVRRQTLEKALKKSERHQIQLREQAQDLQEKMRDMSRSSLNALESERRLISRDLHDDVAQILVSINFHLASFAGKTEISPEVLQQKIVHTQYLVEDSIESILTFAQKLRPPSLDDLGLVASLNMLLKEFRQRSGMLINFKVIGELDQLDSDQRIALYRIIQTALVNVEEHSEATEVELQISKSADDVHLHLSDNGKSFNVKQTVALQSGKHLGLISMRERAEMMGGTFRIKSASGKGTTLNVQIPLNSDQSESTDE